jgi:hypothetical protein
MSDLTLSQIAAYAKALPQDAVFLETVLSNLLKPIYAGIAALKNVALDQKADALGLQLYNVEVQINTYAQDVANAVNAISVYLPLIGGFSLPGSGAVVSIISNLWAEGEKLAAEVQAGGAVPIATAKSYLSQFVTATQGLISLVPSIGTYAVNGVSVSQILVGLEEVAAAL